MTTDKIISIASKLDQQGKFAVADKVFSHLIKTAQMIGSERPDFVKLPGRSGYDTFGIFENTILRMQEAFTAQDFENAKHLALNRVNALSNSLNRILRLSVGFVRGGTRFPSFTVTPDLKTKLMDYWSEIKTLKRLLEKAQTGSFVTSLSVVDNIAEDDINSAIDNLSEFTSIHGDLLNSIRNMFRSSPDKRIQLILQQVAICEAKLTVVLTGQQLSSDFKNEIKVVQKQYGKPVKLDQSQAPVAGWEMPKEFKNVKLPDAAPDIFGGTVSGSKAEVNRNIAKLEAMDDKQFADSYQLLRENAEKAYLANENKFSKEEKDAYESKMYTLKNKYQDILFRDKPKSSFLD